MREHKTAAVTAGVLYITGTVAGVVCKFLVQGPVHDAPDPLAYAACVGLTSMIVSQISPSLSVRLQTAASGPADEPFVQSRRTASSGARTTGRSGTANDEEVEPPDHLSLLDQPSGRGCVPPERHLERHHRQAARE